MKVSVVILNWNGKQETLDCLESLDNCRDVFVIDNGSHDDSVAAIRQSFPSVTILETGVNLGYAGGNNVGIQEALKRGADAVLLLNNDTVTQRGFVEAFIKSAEKHPSVGVWGGYPLRFYDPQKLDHLGGVWNPAQGNFDLIGLNAPNGFQADVPLDYVCGCSIFIRREVFETIGLLESKFFLFWEEADFCMRAKKAGFRVSICKEAVLRHKVSASFVGGSPHKKYFLWRGRLLWIERNCSAQEKERLFDELILPELRHYKKLYWIKRAELTLLKLMRGKNLSEKEDKVRQYRAILQGAQDYSTQTFGAGPSWLFKKN